VQKRDLFRAPISVSKLKVIILTGYLSDVTNPNSNWQKAP